MHTFCINTEYNKYEKWARFGSTKNRLKHLLEAMPKINKQTTNSQRVARNKGHKLALNNFVAPMTKQLLIHRIKDAWPLNWCCWDSDCGCGWCWCWWFGCLFSRDCVTLTHTLQMVYIYAYIHTYVHTQWNAPRQRPIRWGIVVACALFH